jgi:hypothetical protein
MAQFGSLPGPGIYIHGESAQSATWRGKGIVALKLSSKKRKINEA